METKDADNKMNFIWNIAVLVIMVFIAVPYIGKDLCFTMIDYVNLGFHEAGHFILGVLGIQFLTALGGTLGQLFVPFAFSIYFFLKKDYRASLFTVFWFFQNFMGISYYIADAPYQRLPLLGGDGSVHDWVYMFAETGALHRAESLALFFKASGTLGMFASIMAMGFFTFFYKRNT